MRFSVVIALYNKVEYIGQTLASVLAQTFSDFEVVVVDDGSTDGSLAVVEALHDSRIRIVRQKNSGVSQARNVGIKNSLGDWIAFLDADDVWHPAYLAALTSLIDNRPLVDVVATGFHASTDVSAWYALANKSMPEPPEIEVIEDLPKTWMEKGTFFTGSVAIRASVLHTMQPCFPVSETNGEDLDLWFRVAERHPIAFTSQALVGYRLEAGNSLSSSHATDRLAPYLARMRGRAIDGTLDARRADSALRFIAQQKINLARRCLVDGDRKLAVRWIRDAAPSGLGIRRWWVTLSMLSMPTAWIRRIQSSRLKNQGQALEILD